MILAIERIIRIEGDFLQLNAFCSKEMKCDTVTSNKSIKLFVPHSFFFVSASIQFMTK